MTLRPIIFLLVAWTMLPLSARTWTDIQGREIEGDLVRVDGDKAIVKIGEKEARLAIARLSTTDQKFLEEWAKANPSTGGEKLMLFGQELKTNGEITTFKVPMSVRARRSINKTSADDPELLIGVSIPPNFDPKRSHNVLWLGINFATAFTDKYRVVVEMGTVVKEATDAGWIVIAADTVTPILELIDSADKLAKIVSINQDAAEALEKEWPGLKSWRVVSCGFGVGSYVSELWCGSMLRAKYNVVGTMQFRVGGTFQSAADEAIKLSGCKKADYSRLRAFVCFPRKNKIFGDEQKAIGERTADEQTWKAHYGDVMIDDGIVDYQRRTPTETLKKGLVWFAQ